jgi:enamine deaminase RidA (YjgF/YER057c/UK114 family)
VRHEGLRGHPSFPNADGRLGEPPAAVKASARRTSSWTSRLGLSARAPHDHAVTAKEDAVSKTRFINPEALSKPPGYSHVVEATGPGRIVYIAGQLGVDRDGKVAGDFRQQAVQTFENLKSALAAVGAEFRHVVKLNNYLVGREHLPAFREVRDSYLAVKDRPASTTIAISALAREGALIEIEAVAVLPAPGSKAASKAGSKRAVAGRKRRAATKAARSRRK